MISSGDACDRKNQPHHHVVHQFPNSGWLCAGVAGAEAENGIADGGRNRSSLPRKRMTHGPSILMRKQKKIPTSVLSMNRNLMGLTQER